MSSQSFYSWIAKSSLANPTEQLPIATTLAPRVALHRPRTPPPIHLLVNLAADGGRVRHVVERAYAAMRTIGPVEIVESSSARDDVRCAAAAGAAGARALVVLGGDTRVSHAIRGLLQAKAGTPIAMLATTGANDFAHSLGAPVHDFMAMARLVADASVRSVDAAQVDGVVFVNSASFGFDAAVLARTQRPGVARGASAYVSTAIRQCWEFRAFDASIASPDGVARSGRWLTLAFANGQRLGGAFRIAPHAKLDDGVLDCIAVGDTTPVRRAALVARTLRGAHLSVAGVAAHGASHFELTFLERPQFQVDGELHRAASTVVRVGVLPRAFRVFAPTR